MPTNGVNNETTAQHFMLHVSREVSRATGKNKEFGCGDV